MSEYLSLGPQTVADGYSPIFKVQTISVLSVAVSGEGTWQLEGSLDKVRWLKLNDFDNSLETFSANAAPVRFNVEKFRFCRVIVAGSSGSNILNAKGLVTGASILSAASSNPSDSGVSELTFSENKNAQSQINQTILQALDGYTTSVQSGVEEGTFQENKNAQQQINQSIRQALDGYAIASNLTGLEQTEIEHYVQHSEAFGSVLQALDGYAQNSTVTQNFNAQKQVNQSILQALDGYTVGGITGATNLGLGEGVFAQQNGSTLEFKSLIAGTNITLTPGSDSITIDAAGGGGGVSELTFTENKNAQYQVNESIIKALDGYVEPNDPIVAIGSANDGYGGNFTGGASHGHGLISQAAGDGYGGIFKATTGYALFVESDVNNPTTAPLRIVPQLAQPTRAQAGDIYIDAPDVAPHSGMSKLRVFNGKNWDRYPSTVFVLGGAAPTLSATGDFSGARYDIPANSLRVGNVIKIETAMSLASYSSGTTRFEGYLNGFAAGALLWQSTTATPASNWFWIVESHIITILTTGPSGTASKAGTVVFGASSAASTVCPNAGSSLGIDTTVDNYICASVFISGTHTAQMAGMIVTIY